MYLEITSRFNLNAQSNNNMGALGGDVNIYSQNQICLLQCKQQIIIWIYLAQ
jgi:hypothetical protein